MWRPDTTDLLEEALNEINGQLEEDASPGQIADTITKHYHLLLKRWQPVINSLPTTLPVAGKDIAVITTAVIRTINTISENVPLKHEVARFRHNRAKSVHDNYLAYRETGFGRIAAFVLTVVDAQKNPFNGTKYNRTQGK